MNYAKGQNLVKLRIIVAVKPTNTLSMHLYKKDLLRLFSKLRHIFFFFLSDLVWTIQILYC